MLEPGLQVLKWYGRHYRQPQVLYGSQMPRHNISDVKRESVAKTDCSLFEETAVCLVPRVSLPRIVRHVL